MSQSSSFTIYISESGNILDEIEKTLEKLNMDGYSFPDKYKKRMDFATCMLTATVRMADEEDKSFFKEIYNLNNMTVRCSMDVLKSIATIEHYKDACKIVAELMKRFPGDCLFTDHHEDNVLIRFSGDVIVSERYREVKPSILLLNELENIPSTSILSTQEKSDIANAVLDEEVSTRDELEKYSSISILNEQGKLKIYFLIIKAYERANISRLMLSELEKANIPYQFGEIQENEDHEEIAWELQYKQKNKEKNSSSWTQKAPEE